MPLADVGTSGGAARATLCGTATLVSDSGRRAADDRSRGAGAAGGLFTGR
ncbi:MAG TPA: hypothetical protein VFZ21_28565 [Gemmatimonadaceae bacterium]|nr:hypothetical protein [Gemmatimonadaceae bacterium]